MLEVLQVSEASIEMTKEVLASSVDLRGLNDMPIS